MATEAEDQLADAMRRAVEDTQFDPAAIAVARSTVRGRRQILAGVGTAVVLAGVGVVVANLGGATGESDVVATTGAEVRMMNQRNSTGAYPAALLTGSLIVTDSQCLAVKHGSAESPLVYNVFWPAGFTAEQDPSGTAVLYNDTGEPVATEGDTVAIGGGLMPEDFTYPEPGYADYPEAGHPCSSGDIWLAAPGIETVP